MRLYCTATSERASKGQGGNEYIAVVLSVGSTNDSKAIGKVVLVPEGKGYRVSVRFGDDRVTEYRLDENGERQTGGCVFVSEDSNYCDTHGTDKAH